MSRPGGNYGIFLDGRRIGSVMWFAGEPPKKRWVAFGPDEYKEGFPTLREAKAALIKWDARPKKD